LRDAHGSNQRLQKIARFSFQARHLCVPQFEISVQVSNDFIDQFASENANIVPIALNFRGCLKDEKCL
jgi:hypothetical protein